MDIAFGRHKYVFKEMTRMTYISFLTILHYIEPYITPTESYFGNKLITAQERLVLTIRFLVIGEAFRSLSYQFRISPTAISHITTQVTSHITTQVTFEWLGIVQTVQTSKRWRESQKILTNIFGRPTCCARG